MKTQTINNPNKTKRNFPGTQPIKLPTAQHHLNTTKKGHPKHPAHRNEIYILFKGHGDKPKSAIVGSAIVFPSSTMAYKLCPFRRREKY